MNSATQTFSPPLSILTHDGSPNPPKSCLKADKTVHARLYVDAFKCDQPAIAVNTNMNYGIPSDQFVVYPSKCPREFGDSTL